MTSQVPKKVIGAFIIIVACISAYFFFRPYNPLEANGAQDTLKLWKGDVYDYAGHSEAYAYGGYEYKAMSSVSIGQYYMIVWRSLQSGAEKVYVKEGTHFKMDVLYVIEELASDYVFLRRVD